MLIEDNVQDLLWERPWFYPTGNLHFPARLCKFSWRLLCILLHVRVPLLTQGSCGNCECMLYNEKYLLTTERSKFGCLCGMCNSQDHVGTGHQHCVLQTHKPQEMATCNVSNLQTTGPMMPLPLHVYNQYNPVSFMTSLHFFFFLFIFLNSGVTRRVICTFFMHNKNKFAVYNTKTKDLWEQRYHKIHAQYIACILWQVCTSFLTHHCNILRSRLP